MVEVYSKPMCRECDKTKRKLSRLGVDFEEKSLMDSPEILEEAQKRNFLAAPIVVANGVMWSGFDEEKIEGLSGGEDSDWGF